MVLMRLVMRSLGIVSTIVLARILVPEDFGLLAIASAVIGLLTVMGEFSFDLALIRDKECDRDRFDTVWTLTVARNAVVAVLLVLLAEPIAAFYGDERLETVTYWLALAVFVEGLDNVAVVEFRRDLRFDKEFAYLLSQRLCKFAITITLAVLWRDYWALVGGIVGSKACGFVLSYAMRPYRPRLTLSAWRELIDFSKWLFGVNVVAYLASRLDALILGKLLGIHLFGLYNMAFHVAEMPISQLMRPTNRAMYPSYSKVADDAKGLVRLFLDSHSVINMLALPGAVGIMLVADPLIRLALGPKWVASIPLIQILLVFAVFQIVQSNAGILFIAVGRPKIPFALAVLTLVVRLPCLVVGVMFWGAHGAAWAMAASSAVRMCAVFLLLRREFALPLRDVVRLEWRLSSATAIMAAVILLVQAVLQVPDDAVGWSLALGGYALLGVVVDFGALYALWRLCGAPQGPEARAQEFLLQRLRRREATS